MTEHDASRLANKPANPPTNQLPPTNPLPPATENAPIDDGRLARKPAARTSLDTLESSVENLQKSFENKYTSQPPNLATCFRHSGWWAQRKKIAAALVRTNQSDSRIRNFCACGVGAWVQINNADDNLFRIQTNCCHDRMCTPCAGVRARRIQEALIRMMGKKTISFITLTLSDPSPDLTALVDKLYRSFRYLRAHPLWADNVNGGAAFLEIKWNDKAKRWHPHLHILADAKYIPVGALTDAWRTITKDSYIVDIRRVKNLDVIGSYVVKYATKPLNPTLMHDANILDDTIHALRGRRLCLCFGDWYGTPLSAAEDEELSDEMDGSAGWTNFETLDLVLDRALANEPWALQLITSLKMQERFSRLLLLNTS